MLRRPMIAILPALLLVACSSASPGASQGGDQSAAASVAGSAAASQPGSSVAPSLPDVGGDGLASVDLTITGGAKAGHYAADITQGGCSTGAAGAGVFTVASVTLDPDTAFDGPQIFVYDPAAAASGTEDQFSAAFIFDNYAVTVEVNPYLSASTGSDYGSGTATLDNRGSSATLTIVGTTSAGEQVNATIECHQVTNF